METTARSEPTLTFGRYTLVEKMGEGALGRVYRGLDSETGRPVVVRIFDNGASSGAEFAERFSRECRASAGLKHPNIAAVYEMGMEGSSPYIVMEFLGANSLRNLIARKLQLPVETKLSVMIHTAEALACAHQSGVLHGGLSPSKIHLTDDGGVKIRDFGIARILARDPSAAPARPAAPVYLSPEEVQGGDADAQSEIFSAGVLFYEWVTGKHPFHDPDGRKALDNLLQETELPAFERFPHEPPGLWPILKTCLAKDPKDRYASMEEVLDAFRELLRDVADDARFMMAELHASLGPLKKAASRPGAPESTIRLLQDVQTVLSDDERADYASLDRLMNGLIEQQHLLKEAAGAPQALDTARFLSIPKIIGSPAVTDSAGPSRECAANAENHAGQDGSVAPSVAVDSAGQPAPPGETQVAPLEVVAPPEESPQAAPVSSPNVSAEPLGSPALESAAEEAPPDSLSAESVVPVPEGSPRIEILDEEPRSVPETVRAGRFAWFPPLTYRSAAAVLSVLLLVAAFYILLEKGAAESLSGALSMGTRDAQVSHPAPVRPDTSRTAARGAAGQASANVKTAKVLLQEAQALAGEKRMEESKVLLRRVLEIEPENAEAAAALKEAEKNTVPESAPDPALQKQLARISAMIQSGKLQSAKSELDKLRRLYPDSPEVNTLRRRWQSRNASEAEERARREEDQKTAQRRKQKAEEWDRKIAEFLAHGKYHEAGGALTLWLAEDPQNARAREIDSKVQEIQKNLKIYTSALAENRYQDALNALAAAQRLNPSDSGLDELRRQAEARKAAAKAFLTIYRLGAKGTILLDGKPIGSDGEISGESVAIGGHTLTIEDRGTPVVIRNQEFAENQRVVLAYDLSNQVLRPMTEADRDLLAQRRAREAVHRFTVEHSHGIFRGSCRGELSISYSEIVYKSSNGEHSFRMPFHLLSAKGSGKSVDLVFTSDNEDYQGFKFQDTQTADKFRQTWNELKALGR